MLRVPGRVEIPAAGLVLAVARGRGFRRVREPGPGAGPTTAWLDAGRVAGRPLTVRPWRAGDRYRPLGAPGAARVRDILVNLKVPRARRAGLPVVECGGGIVWLPGHRVAEGWAVRGRTGASLRMAMGASPVD